MSSAYLSGTYIVYELGSHYTKISQDVFSGKDRIGLKNKTKQKTTYPQNSAD